MKCPKCDGPNTKRVSTTDPDFTGGAHRCKDCDHQAHWTHFCNPPLPKRLQVEATGKRPKRLFGDPIVLCVSELKRNEEGKMVGRTEWAPHLRGEDD